MGYIGPIPAQVPLTSSDIEDGIITADKLATDAVETAKVKDVNVTAGKLAATQDLSSKTITLPATVAGLGTGINVTNQITGIVPAANLGTGTASATTYLAGDGSYKALSEYDDNTVQSNIAMLGFKVATNGSLVKYNLVDQTIDEFNDTSGVDASASTNETRSSGAPYYYVGESSTTTNPSGATSTDTSVSGYRIEVLSAASGSLVVGSTGNVSILVVGGGGSGGSNYAGGGGAGGLVYKATHELTANTYNWVTGAGGAGGVDSDANGNVGSDSTWTISGGAQEFIAKGGGYGEGGLHGVAGGAGGSGGGGSNEVPGGASNQSSQSGDSGTYGFGFAGGSALGASNYTPGGGGGAGSVGANGTGSSSGNGGTGKDYSSVFGTAVGDSGWFASGGGGGWNSQVNQHGTASAGGGSNGGAGSNGASSAGQANTGGGSGGCGAGAGTPSPNGAGGTGIILVKYADGTFSDSTIDDLTLQSTDTTAEAQPTYGEFVTLIENASGTATLNTDIKGYISRDSGTTFTQGTLVDEGTWGTNKQILGFHDLDISSQPSGTSMCYKITTHNQEASVKETRIYASSIGWR